MAQSTEYKVFVSVEKILNGFIAVIDDEKVFYASLSDLINSTIVQKMVEEDKFFREFETQGYTRTIGFTYTRGLEG